ncbi:MULTISPECIES: hypothetical protein [unclassified Streptomyces]|uniref:hypothetical protein n=1 Tax=unclassified Streptomyces TaxID=2593676 RepID=UPI0022552F8F|nr:MULTISPECIES: hypothetical protein [unclassified Streptomyces]WSP56023.1 hypothetical protein OG306_17755 [Streptomyces sp. NBC_01241]WSU23279.1 hypothetical protein OG508_21560 [Streptomyces sp. NBC_01108]MCX4787749.1 hypothetical protein [Streptomyces sp. NBC_01221]MCX4796505.1 hypothetical protein [Streptomyces sp. NBC_01242]WSJ37750.1 hypothetical protein OG772_18190 [Streptomyces sp. NBC_01321]
MSDNGRIDFAAPAHQARRTEGEMAGVQEDLTKVQATGYGTTVWSRRRSPATAG